MISFWNTFLANLPTLLPNVEEHWAHNIMNDMTSSMMYGVAAICLGDKSPVIVQVEADMLKCADMLITFGTRGYWVWLGAGLLDAIGITLKFLFNFM